MTRRIGRYEILRRLGEGGMGVVYAAQDPDLARQVAVKTLREAGADDTARRRFRREAKAAARVSHPNICQVFEVGESEGELFIAMELLRGESLADRLSRGPLSLPEAVRVGLGILGGLQALHERQLVHRDLKPSNVFLTEHGVKLLDFGLARPLAAAAEGSSFGLGTVLTQTGQLLGTPNYMAPEHVQGEPVDARADLFAVAAIVFEMLTGRHAFSGRTMVEVLHAILYEQPFGLSGSPAIAAVDALIRRGLSKRRQDRPSSAAAMAEELRAVRLQQDSGVAPRPKVMTRLIVLPFRLLRPDPETDFLAVSLPDAITGSLSGLTSLVVRSSLVAARFGGAAPDLARVASEADVDVVLTGTLLRAGPQLRVSTQLQEAPSGALLWSQTSQGPLDDVFALQDQTVQRTVESLSLSLTAREQRQLRHDVPATAKAYEFYLRANQQSLLSIGWEVAAELYEKCVDEDSRYAPAWARLGRVRRLMSKYVPEGAPENLRRAEEAFQRALSLNPDLPLAHVLYAHFEVEAGRPLDALRRLLARAGTGSADPDLFAGLVHVCRYCGLLEASLAADARARSLDRGVRTSVAYTYFMLGEYERAAAADVDDVGYLRCYALAALGREQEARAGYGEMAVHPHPVVRALAMGQLAALDGRREEALEAVRRFAGSGFRDPEGLYFQARILARVGEAEQSLAALQRVIGAGFACVSGFQRDPWLVPLHGRAEWDGLMAQAEDRRRAAEAMFAAEEGPRLLGMA